MRVNKAAKELRAYIHGLGDRTREGQELVTAALKEERERCAEAYLEAMRKHGEFEKHRRYAYDAIRRGR